MGEPFAAKIDGSTAPAVGGRHRKALHMSNRLASSTSPYLLQHRDNPVDWYPWGDEALARAKQEQKPIFLSVGYSSCHWCHVMAHESFEDPETAAFMNEHFVNIKVDREERPDIDSIYMTAVQALTGHGGWPMSVFLTPDQVPYYGGTYWPPQPRQGMPSFRQVLEAVADAWETKRADVEENAQNVKQFLEAASSRVPKATELDEELLDESVKAFAQSFDQTYGGFGNAPKFPQPSIIEFLQRFIRRRHDMRAIRMVELTLDQMAAGGLYDQLGGGFHRYSVDAQWLVPHFEKMLYDNAQLAQVYLDAYRQLGHERYAAVVQETLRWVLREMTSPEGGFYSALDADTEGEEGLFYLWTPEEIDALLSEEDANIAKLYWGIEPGGNFEGRTILTNRVSNEEVARRHGIKLDEVSPRIEALRGTLLAARDERVRPGRDDKIIASWNGMMVRPMAEAGIVFREPAFTDAALRAGEFLLTTLFPETGGIHSISNGVPGTRAFLEDYAHAIDAFLALYQTTFDRTWFDAALRLTKTVNEQFSDAETGLYFDSSSASDSLITRPRDFQDGAVPSGNSVMALDLITLSHITMEDDYRARAEAVLRPLATVAESQPLGVSKALCAIEAYLASAQEIAIAAKVGDEMIWEFQKVYFDRYNPNSVIGLAVDGDEAAIAGMPFLEYRPLRNGEPAAYLCEHFTCMPPVTTTEELGKLLDRGTGITWTWF
jgi:uncharacterized protein YyaL (SSP411 family)